MDNTSHAEQLRTLEGLASACRADRELEDFLSRDLDTFDEALRKVWSALTRRAELESEKQTATRELQDALYDAREQARHLRLGVQLQLGLWNERLEVFGITPRREPRARKSPKP
jgi:hypothetical protein